MQENLQDYVKRERKRTGKSFEMLCKDLANLSDVSRQNVQQWHKNKSPILIETEEGIIQKISREPRIKVYFERRSESGGG